MNKAASYINSSSALPSKKVSPLKKPEPLPSRFNETHAKYYQNQHYGIGQADDAGVKSICTRIGPGDQSQASEGAVPALRKNRSVGGLAAAS